MKSFNCKKVVNWIVIGVVLLITIFLLYSVHSNWNKESLSRINEGLIMDDVKLYLPEEKVINLLGKGEYIEGFGGHLRIYNNLQIAIGFSEDVDNDFYAKSALINFWNPNYSIYGIKPGNLKQDAIIKLLSKGYAQEEDDLYSNGEYIISLDGEQKIERIRISFNDKDLKDRNY